jgi:choline dehydrogenase-like flavoprotein
MAHLLLAAAGSSLTLGSDALRRASGAAAIAADIDAAKPGGNYIDLRRYDGPGEIDCDLCIVGAGAAGITLALTLARPGRRVIVLESGGFDFDGKTQGLYRGRLTGVPYADLSACRLRYFGGSTSHWGGLCHLPKRQDFESRPALGLPGWPITYDEVWPYLVRAAAFLGVDLDRLDPSSYSPAEIARAPMLEARSRNLHTEIFDILLPRARLFGPRFRDAVGTLPDVQVFLHANLTHIGLADNGSTVRTLSVRTLEGQTLAIHPKATILACHAIENARLLLAANDLMQAGIGNASDQLGRNFMDHLRIQAGRFVPDRRASLARYFVDPILPKAQRKLRSYIGLSEEARRANDMLFYFFDLLSQFEPVDQNTGEAVAHLVKGFFRPFETQMAYDAATLMANPMSGTASTLARLGLRARTPLEFNVLHVGETAPNPSSRVTLTRERDALGVPMVSLHWALSDVDIHSLARGQEIVASEINALGLGRVETVPLTRDYVEANVLGHWHNSGTTRMSAAPSAGVVDRNCRVHGTDNLFIAGSSIFPSCTSGWPTMLLLALALRLAEHLNGKVLS